MKAWTPIPVVRIIFVWCVCFLLFDSFNHLNDRKQLQTMANDLSASAR